MQVAEIIRGTRAIYELVFLISISITYVHSLPLQVLPSIPGYIPVYIRHGDQPLEEINPALAEAFHEGSSLSKSINLDNISGHGNINPVEEETYKYDIYPLHIRQVNNHFSTKDEDDKKSVEEVTKTETEKYASNTDKKNRQEKPRRKGAPKPVVKINPLTEEEKEALEKLQIDVKDSPKLLNSNLHLRLSSDEINGNTNEEIFKQRTEVDPTANYSIQPDPSPIKDAAQHSADKDAPISTLANEGMPVKKQRLPNILSNVRKVLPSSDMFLKTEEERTEKQSLKEKSK
ncbi:uncharacterized protein LOC117607123 [Osmia lignaria lignaria]|uniref:uncharacterized protein LOC117607123 n=1 Tax=Osmia lignaria lignaria TaxID=1437193 RepID=UPI00402BF455